MRRRHFNKAATLALGGMLFPIGINSWVGKSIASPNNNKRLVVIFLRGAIDGLNIVIPHQETDYYQVRPSIAVPYPQEKNGAIDLDGFFGLHPLLKDLMPWWQKGNLAFINNCGLSRVTRSHFDAQDYIESGTPGIKNTPDGWMNRLLASLNPTQLTQALNVGRTTPRILKGKMPVANLDPGFHSTRKIPLDAPNVNNAFSSLYSGEDHLSKVYQEGDRARKIIVNELSQEMLSASRGATLADRFMDDAADVAKLMVGDTKTQLAFMEIGGWDTHINEIGLLDRFLPALSKGLATLATGLQPIFNDTTILVISEFGRTVKENGNRGTDHGRGNVIWLLGGAVQGGKIYGEWNGLAESSLEKGRDLPVLIDFRDAISSVLEQHLLISPEKIAAVFPEHNFANKIDLFI